MPEITLDQVSKYYVDGKSRVATAGLYQLSCVIPDGAFAVVVGPSGCGKTTLLKTILGLYQPDEGRVLYDGKDQASVGPNERHAAFVTQEYALYPTMSVFDNIAYPLKLAGVPIEETRTRVAAVAETLGISLLLSRKPRVLSGGQRQRVALARALVKRPDLLLMDEPLSNIDEPTRYALRQTLKEIHERSHITIVLSTHKEEDAYFWADLLLTMENGSLVNVTRFRQGVPL